MKTPVQVGIALLFLGCVFATAGASECSVGGFDVGRQAPFIDRWGDYELFGSVLFHVKGATEYRSRASHHGDGTYRQLLAVKDGNLVAVMREYDGYSILSAILALQKNYGAPVPDSRWIRWSGWSREQAHVTWIDPACGLRIDAFNPTHPDDENGIVVWTALPR